MRQLILAQQIYHATYGKFAGRYPFFGWHRHVLPVLEVNENVGKTPHFVCPSDPESSGEWPLLQSYQENHGTGLEQENGFAGNADWISTANITDGLSNTAAIAERLSSPQFVIHGGFNGWPAHTDMWHRRVRFTEYVGADLHSIVNDCRTRSTASPPAIWYPEVFYTHVMPPNGNSCSNGSFLGFGSRPFAAAPSSFHTGGINLALADGSVRFVADQIDLKVWWALGTRSGGEAIGTEF